MSTFLFNVLIYPIVFILETIFALIYQMIGSAGYSILAVSVVVNVMVIPLYNKSDALQEHERKEQERLAPGIKHIKKTFKGDEQFMILQEYYAQNHYHPLYVLRGSLSMLLEVPFFIAAYYFLSHLTILQGTSFHFIKDLGTPDSIFTIKGITINILPILMTIINFVSGAIYTKGFRLKDKLQLYCLAVLFLVLLYNSPSGLVLYWTMNNVFSLLKNICSKLMKNPQRDSAFFVALLGILFFLFMYFRGKLYETQIIVFSILVLLACFIPLVLWFVQAQRVHARNSDKTHALLVGSQNNLSPSTWELVVIAVLSELTLAILLGVLIPSTVISSSPADYIEVFKRKNPLTLVQQTASVCFGLFIIWMNVILYLAPVKVKRILTTGLWILSALSAVNYFVFSVNGGVLSTDLTYGGFGPAALMRSLINLIVLVLSGITAYLLFRKRKDLVRAVLIVGLSAITFISVRNIALTNTAIRMEAKNAAPFAVVPDEGIIHLSKHGRNVVVLMLDRAVSGYIPYILKEDPQLMDQYQGFTYYPNTLSYAMHTNMGAPALYGGYEYTPKAINERHGMTLADKHNEALKVLPKIFSDNRFDVTLCNTSYAGYTETGDYSIYKDIPNVRAFHLRGSVLPENYDEMSQVHQGYLNHSYLMYSVMCTSPVPIRWWLYDMGCYRGVRRFTDGSPSEEIIEDYTELAELSRLSVIEDDSSDNMFFMVNYLTHDHEMLQLPGYTLNKAIDNAPYLDEWLTQFDEENIRMQEESVIEFKAHYQCNAAAIHLLGQWFDWMRENGVFDNTRIILVADHGADLDQFPNLIINPRLDAQGLNPLLMVKDFDADRFTVNQDFMTNADIPSLAVKDIVDSPVNPYTGKAINQNEKSGLQYVTTSHHYTINPGPVEQFDTSDGEWYTVHTDIFDKENWSLADDYSAQ